MGRPKRFDRGDALAAAIEVFAERGYEGASTDVLLKAMGLTRQSLYDTYGSKRQLYLEALGQYNRENIAFILADLNAGKTPFEGLECALLAHIERSIGRPHPPCLGISAISEFGGRDMDVLEFGQTGQAALLKAIVKTIEQGQAACQIYRDLNAEEGAGFFLSTLSGLKVSARGGVDGEHLRKIARFALLAFTRPAPPSGH